MNPPTRAKVRHVLPVARLDLEFQPVASADEAHPRCEGGQIGHSTTMFAHTPARACHCRRARVRALLSRILAALVRFGAVAHRVQKDRVTRCQ